MKIRIWMILILALVLEVIFIDKNLFWDSAMYVAMAKYIYSWGQLGMYEAIRPPVYPLVLGLFWWLKLNIFVVAHLVVLASSMGVLYLTYLIAKMLKGEMFGLFAAFAMMLSASFIFFSSTMLNDVFLLFLSLLTFYLMFKGKHPFFVGLVASLAFLTRFPAGLLLPTIFVFYLGYFFKDKNVKDFIFKNLYAGLGFLLPVIPYLIFLQLKYNDFMYAFTEGINTINIVSQTLSEGFLYYPKNFLLESVFVIFIFLGIYYLLRKDRSNVKIWTILFFVLAIFSYFSYLGHKEFRYMMIIFPFVYLIGVYGLSYLKKANVWMIVFGIIMAFQLIAGLVVLDNYFMPTYDDLLEDYYHADVEGFTVLSSPLVLAYQDVESVIIYSVQDKMYYYFETNFEPENYIINTCNLFCSTEECQGYKEDFFGLLDENYDLVFYEEFSGCEYYVYTKY